MHDRLIPREARSLDDVVVPISARFERGNPAPPHVTAALETIDSVARLIASSRAEADLRVREAEAIVARVVEQLAAREADVVREEARNSRMVEQLEVASREAAESREAADRRARILEDRIEELLSRAQALEDELRLRVASQDRLTAELRSELMGTERRASEAEQSLRQLVTYITQKLGEQCSQAEAA